MRARVGVGDAGGSEQNAVLGQLSVQKAGRGDRRLPEATKQTKNKQTNKWLAICGSLLYHSFFYNFSLLFLSTI